MARVGANSHWKSIARAIEHSGKLLKIVKLAPEQTIQYVQRKLELEGFCVIRSDLVHVRA